MLWDNGWYGGHHMPGYSVLFPPLAALLGPRVVGALAPSRPPGCSSASSATSTAGRVAALWFAVATRHGLVTGRLTFALGVAVGLAAVLALPAGAGLACALAALTTLASPVAGALPRARRPRPWWLDAPRGWPVALAATRSCPPLALVVAFPEGGSFPFVGIELLAGAGRDGRSCGLVAPARRARVRIGVALYALALVASFALATPMGGNVVRLGALFAGPVLVALVWRRAGGRSPCSRCRSLYWQWVAPVDDWARAAGDPSCTSATTPACSRFLGASTAVPSASRSRSPTTTGSRAGSRRTSRWRAAGSASSTASSTRCSTTASDHRGALPPLAATTTPCASSRCPTRRIDYSAAREAALVRARHPVPARGLARRALARLRRRGARPLADGAARVTAVEPDACASTAARAGRRRSARALDAVLADRAGPRLRREGPGGWTRVHAAGARTGRLAAAFAIGRVRASAPRCTG